MTIHVTEQDIKDGVRFAVCLCPIAIAIHRTLHPKFWCVSPVRLTVDSKSYPTPIDVGSRMRLYDNCGEMEPFSFELDLA